MRTLLAICRAYGIEDVFAELMEDVADKETALQRVIDYKRGLMRRPSFISLSGGTDDVGRSIGSGAGYFSQVGQCLQCRKLIHREWGFCPECVEAIRLVKS